MSRFAHSPLPLDTPSEASPRHPEGCLLCISPSLAPPPPGATTHREPRVLHSATLKPPWHKAAVSHFHLFFNIRFQNFNNFTLALTISTWRRVKSVNQVYWAVVQWQRDTHGHCLSCLRKNTGHLAILAMVQEQKMPSFHLRGILQSHRNLPFFYFFDSLLCNENIYQKIIAFVYCMPIFPLHMHKPNVISDWIERCFQFPIYFLIQCISL